MRSKIFDGGRLGEGPINLPYRLRETNIKNLLVPADVRARLRPAARVGLEDSLYIGKGKLAASNSQQVLKIRRILEELGYADSRLSLASAGR